MKHLKFLASEYIIHKSRMGDQLEDCDFNDCLNSKLPRELNLPSQQALHPMVKRFYSHWGYDWRQE